METFLLVSAIQGYLVSLAVFKGIQKPNKRLGYYLLILILIVSTYLLISSQVKYSRLYPKIFFFSYVLFFLYSPIYYLFVNEYLGVKKIKRVNYIIGFLPAGIYLATLIWNLFFDFEGINWNNFYRGLAIIDITSILANYYLLSSCWILLKKKNQNTKSGFSKKIPFYIFTSIFGLINSVWLLFIISQLFKIDFVIPFSLDSVYAIMSIIIYVFTYALIVNKELVTSSFGLTMNSYAKTSISEEELRSIEENIRNVITTKKLYKDPNFSLLLLSEQTSVDKLKLSYTINHHMGTTFNMMISKYRVEEFIRLYNSTDLKHYNTLGIANEAGFKSKSTFYKAFKEITGKTPKEFFSSVD
tara:strand:+ start:27636 stop:28706 length:1071 start_codon:yes stop_codon:yes gene_type:complete